MLLIFSCENCGKRFQVDESAQGKRGRCKDCGHVMKIPQAGHAHVAGHAKPHAPDTAFHLSAEESVAPSHQGGPHHPSDMRDTEFEFVVDKAELAAALSASPEEVRRLREIESFKKDRRGYNVVDDRGGGLFSFFGRRDDGPASGLYVKWRSGVAAILKVLRFIDDWAYLISVPFLILVLFAIVTSSRGLVHAGAVVVVLVNYGRFWADLASFFVRPFKESPIQGLLFLLPPYTVYYVFAHWDRMTPSLRRMLTSCLPIALVIVAYAFLPSVNPEVKDVTDVGARLKIGTEALKKDLEGGLEQIEEELSGKEKAEKKPSPPPDKP
jgi:ribosomal protein S27E